MINPVKPHAEVENKMKKLKRYVIGHYKTCHIRRTASVISVISVVVIAGEKNCSKTGHRLRPPAVVVLDFH